MEKGFNVAQTCVEKEHHNLEKGLNFVEIGIEGRKLLGEKGLTFQKQALREGHVLREINKILGKGLTF